MRSSIIAAGLLVVLAPLAWAQQAEAPEPAAAVSAASQPASAPSATSQPGGRLRGEYQFMTSAANLSPAQQAQVSDLLAQRAGEFDEWDKAHEDASARLRLDLRQARLAKDEEGIKKLEAQIADLRATRGAIEQKYAERIEQVMTADQRLAWEEFRLDRAARMQFRRAQLSQEQLERIKQMARQEAPQVMAAPIGQARQQVCAKALDMMAQQVLTAEQRKLCEGSVRRHSGSRPTPAAVDSIPGPPEQP